MTMKLLNDGTILQIQKHSQPCFHIFKCSSKFTFQPVPMKLTKHFETWYCFFLTFNSRLIPVPGYARTLKLCAKKVTANSTLVDSFIPNCSFTFKTTDILPLPYITVIHPQDITHKDPVDDDVIKKISGHRDTVKRQPTQTQYHEGLQLK